MPTTTCRECGETAEWESFEDAIEDGWCVDEDEEDNDLCPDHSARCYSCGTTIDPEAENTTYADGRMYCSVCANQGVRSCSECGAVHSRHNQFNLVNINTHALEVVCGDCIRRTETIKNTEYGNRGFLTEVELVNANGHIFQLNLDDKVKTRCPVCEGDYEPCAECAKRIAEKKQKEETTLWVYDTFPRGYHESDHEKFKQLKYREDHEHPFLYYGMELELLFQSRESIENICRDFIKATNGMFVAEYDRSVTNLGNGIEFISRPMSYKKWTSREIMDLLKAGFSAIEKYNPCSPQPDGCGIHVHMSKIFFTKNTEKDVEHIKSDMDWIFQVFQPEIEKLSQRKYSQYCASKAFKIKQQLNNGPATQFLKGKLNISREIQIQERNSNDHHNCVAITPRTIEVRTFKSTINPKEIVTIIELCRALAHAARNKELTSETTLADILFSKDNTYLTDYVRKQKVDTTKTYNAEVEIEL